jgi:hypothetical protein
MRRKWFILQLVIFVMMSSSAFAVTCATPAPAGCGDTNLSITSFAKNVLSTGSITALPNTACCDCRTVSSTLRTVFDSLRRNFILDVFNRDYFNPELQRSIAAINSFTLGQSALTGATIDGQTNIQSVQSFQSATAQSLKNNQSSEALCRFASVGKSLAADDVKRRAQQILFSEIGLARSLGTEGSPAASGAVGDMGARIAMFVSEFCDKKDHNNGLALMCAGVEASQFASAGSPLNRKNADINFVESISLKPTLSIDLASNTILAPDEQTIIAMSYNLYGHKAIAPRFSESELQSPEGRKAFLRFRSLLAGRSLTQNSFAVMVAERAQGTGASKAHMSALLTEMGIINQQDIDRVLGPKPSYYAQMNLLTRSLYQNTNFYGTLMEGKTNVARQSAYMSSIDLMQDRDIYHSSLRSELLLASLIELQTRRRVEASVEGLNR